MTVLLTPRTADGVCIVIGVWVLSLHLLGCLAGVWTWGLPRPAFGLLVWCGRSGSWNAETEVRTERLKLRESVYFQETEGFIGGARVGSSDSCYVGAAAASV